MPCPFQAGNELNDLSIAAHEEVRRHLQSGYCRVIRMSRQIQGIGEQPLHTIAAKLVGRQADVVYHQ